MYNISESLISFEVVENGSVIHSGQIPYDLLTHVSNVYILGTDRILRYTVMTNQFSYSDPQSVEEKAYTVDRATNFNPSIRSYYDLQLRKAFIEAETRLIDEERLRFEAHDEATRLEGQRLLTQFATEAEIAHQEMLLQQQQLTQAQLDALLAEQLRVDTLRSQTVTMIAVDPTKAVDALLSEVGDTGDVRRQIASVVKNKDIALLVINSTATNWMNSFEIVDEIANHALIDTDVAQLLVDKLPEDSLLRSSLIILGKAS